MTPVARLVHADWSSRAAGRWAATALRTPGGWRVDGPVPVGDLPHFVDGLFCGGPVLAGFDMPIGLPRGFGRRTGLPGFRAALAAFGTGAFAHVYEPAGRPEEIGTARPFFPARPGARGTTLHAHLAAGHGVASLDDLRRRCERATAADSRAASPLFWTLGPAAVGKAAIHGWQHLIGPACGRGAALWPFDGADLGALSDPRRPVLAETYPGSAYRWLGLPQRGWSKRRRADRAALAPLLRGWAAARGISFAPGTAAALREGIGPVEGSDDGFDALVGLLGMIAVAAGERGTGLPADDPAVTRWEGWILGRAG